MTNRIGSYEIKEVIGKGGMGTVYRAMDLTLHREVALKVINPELSQNAILMKRFRNEALAMARLNHPNIVVLYHFTSDGNVHYIVMEYIRGKSLSQIIGEEGALSWGQTLPLFTQILNAIDYAHGQGIIHRDIKPSNFIVQPNGTVKVTDFGVAKVFGGEELTRGGTTLGTCRYMSPEQILAQPIGPSSDIYSLGITLYEMVTGRVPFSGNSDFEIQKGHLELPPPPPRKFNPALLKDIETAILRSIEKRPENRFPSVPHFLDALSQWHVPVQEESFKRGLSFPILKWLKENWREAVYWDQWVVKYQHLPMVTRWMILLVGLFILILFFVILFSIS